MSGAVHVTLGVLKWVGIVLAGFLALVVVGSVVLPSLTRGLTDRWGATDAEVADKLPGDELVRDPQQSATRAITIAAPASLVRQLIRQQGYKRAGWHGWDWFYNATGSGDFVDGHFSTRVVPELQDVALGDRVFINSAVSYEVVSDDPGAFLLWSGGDSKGKTLSVKDAAAATGASTSWAWIIREVDPGTTRLILRVRGDMRGQGPVLAWLFDKPFDLGGALFANKTLHGIKNTAEALAGQNS